MGYGYIQIGTLASDRWLKGERDLAERRLSSESEFYAQETNCGGRAPRRDHRLIAHQQVPNCCFWSNSVTGVGPGLGTGDRLSGV
jgi:hypothetical protein